MAKEVSIDADVCNGCENCVIVCPDIFRFNENTELAEVINPDSTDQECIAEAIDVCPVDCIYWK